MENFIEKALQSTRRVNHIFSENLLGIEGGGKLAIETSRKAAKLLEATGKRFELLNLEVFSWRRKCKIKLGDGHNMPTIKKAMLTIAAIISVLYIMGFGSIALYCDFSWGWWLLPLVTYSMCFIPMIFIEGWILKECPVFALYTTYNPECSVKCGERGGDNVIISSLGPVPNFSDGFKIDEVEKQYRWLRPELWDYTLVSKFVGLLPGDAREIIQKFKLRPIFFYEIFVLAEANWETKNIINRDLLVLGWDGDNMWILGKFTSIPLEQASEGVPFASQDTDPKPARRPLDLGLEVENNGKQ